MDIVESVIEEVAEFSGGSKMESSSSLSLGKAAATYTLKEDKWIYFDPYFPKYDFKQLELALDNYRVLLQKKKVRD